MSAHRFDRCDAVTVFVVVATSAITAVVYPRLPASVPVHFDLHAHADGFMPRALGAFLLPVFTLLIGAFLRLSPWILSSRWKGRLENSPLSALTLCLVSLFVGLQLVILYAALVPHGSIGAALSIALGLFCLGLGALMPRTRRNPIVGVRTAWTLASDENWARTHRVAGITMSIGGVIAIVAGLGKFPAVAILSVIATMMWPAVYSFVLARKLQR